jgi:hypothetical protein
MLSAVTSMVQLGETGWEVWALTHPACEGFLDPISISFPSEWSPAALWRAMQ